MSDNRIQQFLKVFWDRCTLNPRKLFLYEYLYNASVDFRLNEIGSDKALINER